MGVISFIKKILFGEKQPERFSDSQRFESMNQLIRIDLNRAESERIELNRAESMNQSIESPKSTIISSEKEEKPTISIDKESLKVGMAAGYISRSLISIEDGIERIEISMPSKEWITMNILPKIEQVQQAIYNIREILMDHERNEEKRFEVLLEAINKLKTMAPSLPEPIKTEILSTVASLKSATLTPKMQQILDILKERREISYQELAEKLGITTDGLRGILSRMVKVCDEIERFEKDGKGWIRIKSIQSDLNRSESLDQSSRLEIKEQKEENKENKDLSDMP
ncbi:MAG: winged helix-turn-helix transcriptional regulator [Candidatus Aenigmarchaeota archaeon]|nr:winged helix-turn-helix transcriptional regulator [Candidatus Aenigmarchaeota archaeon]